MLMLFVLVVFVVVIIGMWKVFEKAGQPGWACIIPFYNAYILVKIAGRPGWWFVLYFIPLVNIIISIVVSNDISKNFGRGLGTTLGLIFLAPIFFCILGFGSAQYNPPIGAGV